MHIDLSGRTVLVTGASRGIGVGIARRLASEGAAVAIAARSVEARPGLPGTLGETVERISGSLSRRRTPLTQA